jgi:hypothetical protein
MQSLLGLAIALAVVLPIFLPLLFVEESRSKTVEVPEDRVADRVAVDNERRAA